MLLGAAGTAGGPAFWREHSRDVCASTISDGLHPLSSFDTTCSWHSWVKRPHIEEVGWESPGGCVCADGCCRSHRPGSRYRRRLPELWLG